MKLKKIQKKYINGFNFIVNMDDYGVGMVLTNNRFTEYDIERLCSAFLHAYVINKTKHNYGYSFKAKGILFDLDDEDMNIFVLDCGYSDYNRTTWSCDIVYTSFETEYSVDISDITDEDIVSFLNDKDNNTLKDKILELLDKA